MTQIREALDKYLDDRQRAKREFWAMVWISVAVVVGCVWSLGRLQP